TLAYRGDVKGALGALWEGAGSPEEKRALTVALLEHCPDAESAPADGGEDASAICHLAVVHRALAAEEPRETELVRVPVGAWVGNVHSVGVPEDGTTRFVFRLSDGTVEKTVDTRAATGEELEFRVERPGSSEPHTVVRELWRADNRTGPTRPLKGDRHDFVVLPCRVGDYVREKEEQRLEEAGRRDAPEADPYLALLDYCVLSDRLLAGIEEDEGVEARFSQPRILIFSRFNLAPQVGGPCEALDLRQNFVDFAGKPVACYAAVQTRSLVEAGLEQFWLEGYTGRPCLSTFQLFCLLSDDTPDTYERRLRLAVRAFRALVPGSRVVFRAQEASVEAQLDADGRIRLRSGPLRADALERLARTEAAPGLPLAAEGLDASFASAEGAALAAEIALSAADVDPPLPPDYRLQAVLERGDEPLVVSGARFAFGWGEGEERTEQEIRITGCRRSLGYRWRIHSGVRPTAGTRTVKEGALAKATTHNPWYRMGASEQDAATSFVVSRFVHAELAAGRPVDIRLLGRYGPEDDPKGARPVEWSGTLVPAGRRTVEVPVNGRPQALSILVGRLSEGGEEIGILDDPRWPIGIADRLTAIHTAVRGRLVDKTGVGIAGARLSLGEATCSTSFDGSFRLPPLEPDGYGPRKIRVERDKQLLGEVEVDLTAPGLDEVVVSVPRPRRELLSIAPRRRKQLEQLPLSEQLKRHARRALDAGRLVLVPNRMLVYGAGRAIGFFAFDPATGETVGVLENGLHGSSSAEDEAWQSLVDSVIAGAGDISKEGLSPIHMFRGALIAWWAYSAYRLEGDTHLEAVTRLLADMDAWEQSTNFFSNLEKGIGGRAGSKAREKLAGMIGGNMDGDAAAAAF
ncbi:MAG: hypothetical protein ACYTJ0_18920, partial [Planctomycetota bacterium]